MLLTLNDMYGNNYLNLSGSQDIDEALMEIIVRLQEDIVLLEEVRKTKKLSLAIHKLRVTLSALHCFGALHLGLTSENKCVHTRDNDNQDNGFYNCYLNLPGPQNIDEALMAIIWTLQDNIVLLEEVRKTTKLSRAIHNLRVTLSALHCLGAFHLHLTSENMCLHSEYHDKQDNCFHVCTSC